MSESINEIISCYNIDHLPQNHKNYLITLKQSGFEPEIIYDIGSAVLHWTKFVLKLWPKAHIYLFEANSEVFFIYEQFQKEHPEYNLHWNNVLLSDTQTIKKYYKSSKSFGGNSYYIEQTHFFDENNFILLETSILDNFDIPEPNLVKIDTQGSEYDIINGSRNKLKKCEHLIVEIQHTDYNKGAPKVETTLPFIESLGFVCISKKFSDNTVDADYGFINKEYHSDDVYIA